MADRYPVKITYSGEAGHGTLETRLSQRSFSDMIAITDVMVRHDQAASVEPLSRIVDVVPQYRMEPRYRVVSECTVDDDWIDTITERCTLRSTDLAAVLEWVAERAAVEDGDTD